MRRAILAVAIAAAAFAVTASAAVARTSIRTLETSVSPTTAGTPAHPRTASINLRLLTKTDDGSTPHVGARDDIFISKGFRINETKFAACSAAVLNDPNRGPSRCPAGSRVGFGSAAALAGDCTQPPPASEATRATVAIQIFNGGAGRLNAWLSADQPVRVAQLLKVRIIRVSSRLYGLKFSFAVPEEVQQPIPNVCAALVDVKLIVSKKTVTKRVRVRGRTVSKRYGFLESIGCPSSHKWSFRDDVGFRADGKGSGSAKVACR